MEVADSAEMEGARLTVQERLEEELEALAHELTVRIPRRLGLEQCHGEYLSAVERQQTISRRIRVVSRLLAGLPLASSETLWGDRVGYGSTVFLRNLETGCEATFMLVSPDASNPSPGEIPLDSTLGTALLGCRVGSEVVLAGTHQDSRIRLVALYTLPYCLGLSG